MGCEERKKIFLKHGVNKFPKRQDNVLKRGSDICVVWKRQEYERLMQNWWSEAGATCVSPPDSVAEVLFCHLWPFRNNDSSSKPPCSYLVNILKNLGPWGLIRRTYFSPGSPTIGSDLILTHIFLSSGQLTIIIMA